MNNFIRNVVWPLWPLAFDPFRCGVIASLHEDVFMAVPVVETAIQDICMEEDQQDFTMFENDGVGPHTPPPVYSTSAETAVLPLPQLIKVPEPQVAFIHPVPPYYPPTTDIPTHSAAPSLSLPSYNNISQQPPPYASSHGLQSYSQWEIARERAGPIIRSDITTPSIVEAPKNTERTPPSHTSPSAAGPTVIEAVTTLIEQRSNTQTLPRATSTSLDVSAYGHSASRGEVSVHPTTSSPTLHTTLAIHSAQSLSSTMTPEYVTPLSAPDLPLKDLDSARPPATTPGTVAISGASRGNVSPVVHHAHNPRHAWSEKLELLASPRPPNIPLPGDSYRRGHNKQSRAGGPQRSDRGSRTTQTFRDQDEPRSARDWRALSSSDPELRPVRPKSGKNVRRLSKRVPDGIAIGEGLKKSLAAKKATASPYQRPSPRKDKVVDQVKLDSPAGRYHGLASDQHASRAGGSSRARDDDVALSMIASQMGAASLGNTEDTATPQPQPAQTPTPVPTPQPALAALQPPNQRPARTHDVLDEIASKMGATSLEHDDESDTMAPGPQPQPAVAPDSVPAPPPALAPPLALAARPTPSRTKVLASGAATTSSSLASRRHAGEPVASGSGSH